MGCCFLMCSFSVAGDAANSACVLGVVCDMLLDSVRITLLHVLIYARASSRALKEQRLGILHIVTQCVAQEIRVTTMTRNEFVKLNTLLQLAWALCHSTASRTMQTSA